MPGLMRSIDRRHCVPFHVLALCRPATQQICIAALVFQLWLGMHHSNALVLWMNLPVVARGLGRNQAASTPVYGHPSHMSGHMVALQHCSQRLGSASPALA